MAVRPIVLSDDPVIRKKSRKVRTFSPSLEALVSDMVDTMEAAAGIGLAAIQIGVPERVIVVRLPEDEEKPESGVLHVVVNPKLARKSREIENGIEGCLSIPGFVGEVPRHVSVTVKGKDLRGRPLRVKTEGLLARVFQHETDHCDGVLYIDHIDDPENIWQVPEGEEEAAELSQTTQVA
jgi:peptide deformylase